MSIRLHDIAHCRAGDKGNTSTLSVIAYDEAMYPLLCRALTVEAVRAHLSRNIEGCDPLRDAERRRTPVRLPSGAPQRRDHVADHRSPWQVPEFGTLEIEISKSS